MTDGAERAVTFEADKQTLVGILHEAAPTASVGLLILVGGPQYRVGSHRMFVRMAREFALRGYPVLRFDFAGMGDSEGVFRGFEKLDGDIAAALRQFGQMCPALERFVLVGLCDGATAAAYYAGTDRRVAALALLNPWVHTAPGAAKVYLWYYYPRRLLQLDLWTSLLRGRVSIAASLGDLLRHFRRVFAKRKVADEGNFVDRMREALAIFQRPMLVLASENDYAATEFVNLWTTDARWQGIRESATFVPLNGADHTLSSRDSMQEFCATVLDWLDSSVSSNDGR
jgi:exosortase A-associated hydrolase 1